MFNKRKFIEYILYLDDQQHQMTSLDDHLSQNRVMTKTWFLLLLCQVQDINS